MMIGCKKCTQKTGVLLLVIGIIYLLNDFKIWNFWGIQWWSALFVVLGATALASSTCKDCCAR